MRQLDDELVERAKALWSRGNNLGQIAAELQCSIYALTPWIYAEQLDEVLDQKLANLNEAYDS